MRKKTDSSGGNSLPGMELPSGPSAPARKTRPLDFSYSRMSMYTECPLKFKFRYVDKIPEKPKSYFAFGHSVHSALEFLYGVKSPPFPTAEETLRAFENDWKSSSWADKGYLSAELAEKDFMEGRRMLTAYYRKHGETLSVPLAVEYKTNLKVDGLSVMSVVDRIDYLGEGRISIVDYKTGKDVKRDPDQLHMYQKICETDPGLKKIAQDRCNMDGGDIRVEKLVFYHVPSLKENVFERSPEDELKIFWDKVLGVAESIASGRFEPTPGERQCKFCDYKKFCPVFAGGASSPASCVSKEPAGEQLSEEEKLSALVDRFGELKESIHRSEAECEELKNKITSLMKEKGYRHHYGKKFKIEWEAEEKWVFKNRILVIDTLKELGLYDRTLAPTHASIQRLLSDLSVPEACREKLRELGEKTLHVALHCKKLDG